MFPDLSAHAMTLARLDALYLLAVPAVVLLWGLIFAGELRRIWAPIMRALVLALFVLALANPQKVMRTEGAARPAVVDASGSITPAMRTWTAKLLRDDLHLRSGDPALTFATHTASGTIGDVEADFDAGKRCAQCDPAATDIEGALVHLASDPDARGGPAVLVTDGWENRGDAGRAVNALLSAEIRLDIFTPPGAKGVPNVAMTELTLPPALTKAAPFALGVTMQNLNDSPVAGTISIYRDDAQIDQRRVVLKPGDQRFDFPVRSDATGLVAYSATFKPDNPAQDMFQEDDSLKGWVGVGAQRKVLLLTDTARDAQYLETVVRRMGLDPVTVTTSSGAWNGSLSGYDAILINNVPSGRISPAAQNAIASYVERGGSLAMIGGDSSFGLGGYESSPLAKVMPVLMKPPQHRERKRALVVIIDKSGSMGRNNKLLYAKAAAVTVIKSLKDSDLVSVIGFDSQPFVVVPLAPLSQTRGYFDQMVGQLAAHGTTYLIPALRQTARDLADSGAQDMHVIILTDGETGGTPDMYYDLVSEMHHEMGASISTIAIGRDANVDLLQSIARYGGGAYYQTDSPQNLPQIFLDDYRTHGGQNTMVEKSFSPQTVSPDPLLKDLAGRQLPTLLGYVSTDLKPRADLSVYVDRGGTKEPIVASWKYGAGKALAVTTDASGRWSGQWVRSNVFQPVWDRLLTWMTPETTTSEPKIDVALGYNAGHINIKLTDYGVEGAGAVHVVNALVTRPDGSKVETMLSEDVPGELSGSIEAAQPGNYYFEVHAPFGKDQKFPPLAYTVSPAVNAEVPRPEPNFGLLEKLASATGGRLNPDVSEIATSRPMVERRQPLNLYLILAAMVLMIAEALVRRLTA